MTAVAALQDRGFRTLRTVLAAGALQEFGDVLGRVLRPVRMFILFALAALAFASTAGVVLTDGVSRIAEGGRSLGTQRFFCLRGAKLNDDLDGRLFFGQVRLAVGAFPIFVAQRLTAASAIPHGQAEVAGAERWLLTEELSFFFGVLVADPTREF